MPKAGKKVKGSAKVKDGLSLEVDALKAEEEAKKKEEWNRIRLLQKLEEETKLSAVNAKLIENFWRDKMREAKTIELKKQIEVLAQQHDRQVDRKDAILSMLLADLDEAEEQYRMTLRTHLQNVDALIALHRERISDFEREFEVQLHDLQIEFDEERKGIIRKNEDEKQEIEDIIAAMKKEHESAEDEMKQEFSTQRDDLKNKNTEEYTVLKITLEKIIEEYRHRMQEEHDAYTAATEGTLKEYQNLMSQDQETAKTIDTQMRKIQRLQEQLAHWKAKLANAVRDGEVRNTTLRAEKENILRHLKDLKEHMNRFRESERKHIAELVSNAHKTIKVLEDRVAQGDRILRLVEMNAKLETEREKVIPFYKTNLNGDEEALAREQVIADGGGLVPQTSVETSVDGVQVLQLDGAVTSVDYDGILAPLEGFYKRLNKVTLDKMALEEERTRLVEENGSLKAMLKEYLDGVSVNEDVMNRANPLMVVNQAPRKKRSELGATNGRGLVEAAIVVHQMAR
eukprot:ANDGO_02237.mRNA.1 Coiled-coil domain-containing protein 65 homolog